MRSTTQPRKRSPLPISALLAIAAACAALFAVAIPAPHAGPGGFANAAQPTNPGVDPRALPSLRTVAERVSNGVGEVASAVVAQTTRPR